MTEYWRNLSELSGAPESSAARAREFPEGAAETPDGISRRNMLALMGASLSLSGLAACRRPVETIVPYVQAPEHLLPGVPVQYATTMPYRGTALGLLVQSHEGRPTKIEGNELHPATQGASNVWAQSAIYDLYDADRARVVSQAGSARTWKDFVDYWTTLHAEHVADGGAGLAIVAEPSTSPTEARVLAALRTRFPQARLVTYAPLGDEAELTGLAAAAGGPVVPIHRLADARVIVALDADFLLHDRDAVRLAREFAAGRRDPDAMNRLYVAESALTTTGVSADHRLAVRSGGIAILTLALAGELGVSGGIHGSGDIDSRWVKAVAKDLKANAGRSVVLVGAHQPAEVHAAVAALNAALGNVGKTVLYAAAGGTRSRTADLAALAKDLAAGTVKTLVVLGGNPAYDAPADLDFATVAAKAPNRIRLGAHVDETSAVAEWHLPQAHFLESWGDARATDGTASVIQPLIEPLFGGRSTIEVLALLESGTETAGYDLVRETWKPLLSGDFERAWQRVLHDGVLAAEKPVPNAAGMDAGSVAKLAASPAAKVQAAPGTFELVFQPSATVYDGRGANNAWLQELPEPVTKLTWDNVACFSKTDAEALGLNVGDESRGELGPVDLVTIEHDGRSLTAPAIVVPGQAAGSIAVALGYGRRAAGRVGTGVGFDAYALRTTKSPGFVAGVTVKRAGATHVLAITSEHWQTEGRDIVRERTVEQIKHPHDDHGHGHHPPIVSPWEERAYEDGPQWGMAIDLSTCIGCNACVVACQSENNIPVVGKDQVQRGREMHWIRVDRYFSGTVEAPTSVVFQPVPCMHCENAPCEQVCPVAATVHGSSGLNEMVYNRCIGTRYCSNNCPYKVRRFNFYNFTKDTPETLQMAYNPDVTVRARGVMEKCSYCVQRLERAQIDAKVAGRSLKDGDVKTACQQACPAQAIEFGDIRDPESHVAKAKQSARGYDLLQEFNTKPRTSYLARIRNPNPELAA